MRRAFCDRCDEELGADRANITAVAPLVDGRPVMRVVIRVEPPGQHECQPDLCPACFLIVVRQAIGVDDLVVAVDGSMQYLRETLGPCEPDCACLVHSLDDALAKARRGA